jgi:hypothetical protein
MQINLLHTKINHPFFTTKLPTTCAKRFLAVVRLDVLKSRISYIP